MSHSKHTKRDYSIHIEKWNRSAKKYINVCAICGRRGYSPVIEAEVFKDKVTCKELTRTLPRLALDDLGRCSECAKVQDRKYGKM